MVAYFHHIEDITDSIKTFWFKPERPLRYEAGQFIELLIPHTSPDNRGEKRWFTLSSSPTDELLSITTKFPNQPSSFKRHLLSLKPRDSVQVTESMGDFVLPKDKATPLIFVAGGVGITPVHSMVKFLQDTDQKRVTHLVYNASSPNEIAFKDMFDTVVSIFEYVTDRRLSSNDVLAVIEQYDDPLVYLSGPEEMVEVLVAELKEQGVPGSRLVTDYFPGYAGAL